MTDKKNVYFYQLLLLPKYFAITITSNNNDQFILSIKITGTDRVILYSQALYNIVKISVFTLI